MEVGKLEISNALLNKTDILQQSVVCFQMRPCSVNNIPPVPNVPQSQGGHCVDSRGTITRVSDVTKKPLYAH